MKQKTQPNKIVWREVELKNDLKSKQLAAFPTNHPHKALVSLNNQTFYGAGLLTKDTKNEII